MLDMILNPCPFCGGDAKLATPDDSSSWYYVYCVDHINCGALGPSDLGWSGAIESWNTRVFNTLESIHKMSSPLEVEIEYLI